MSDKLSYPRCAACGFHQIALGCRLDGGGACPQCGEDAIVTSEREHHGHDTARLADEGKAR